MFSTEDTAPNADLEDSEDNVIFLDRQDMQSYFGGEGIPGKASSKSAQHSWISYLLGLFRQHR